MLSMGNVRAWVDRFQEKYANLASSCWSYVPSVTYRRPPWLKRWVGSRGYPMHCGAMRALLGGARC
jgi:hypothetical protein